MTVDALDGNSIAGELFAVYGHEMTTVAGACANCGRISMLAELRVYGRAPWNVGRCPHCGEVVLVLSEIHGTARIDAQRFALHAQA